MKAFCEKLNYINWKGVLTSSGVCVQLLYDHISDILSCVIEKHVTLETPADSIKKPHHLSEILKKKLNLFCKSKNGS